MIYTPYYSSIIKSKNIKRKNNFFTFKEHPQILFSYVLIEKFIHNKPVITNKYTPSIYHTYFSWINFNNKVNNNNINLDSIIRYFTSLFIFKMKNKLNGESPVYHFFNTYNFFYTNFSNYNRTLFKLLTSKENRYFYTQKTDIFFKSEIFQTLQENNLVLFNDLYKLFPGKKVKKVKKINKFDKNVLVSNSFSTVIKSRNYAINKDHIKIKFKRLFKFSSKIKVAYTNKLKLPFNSIFTKKIQLKKKGFNSKFKENVYNNNTSVVSAQSFVYKLAPTQFTESYVYQKSTDQIKKRISILTHSRFCFYKLNALSIARFQFETNRKVEMDKKQIITKKKKSAEFLNQLEQKRESRYRYVAIYIKDLVRITFFCMYLKKADFIANFYAFLLSKLPRKRKETKLIKFFVTLLKVFSVQRPERIAIRLRFQGRLNRWRRTKSITGQKGSLQYYSYKSRIEFGIGQAITRKGTQGIRVWLCYDAYFKEILKRSIFDYMSLSTLNNKF